MHHYLIIQVHLDWGAFLNINYISKIMLIEHLVKCLFRHNDYDYTSIKLKKKIDIQRYHVTFYVRFIAVSMT